MSLLLKGSAKGEQQGGRFIESKMVMHVLLLPSGPADAFFEEPNNVSSCLVMQQLCWSWQVVKRVTMGLDGWLQCLGVSLPLSPGLWLEHGDLNLLLAGPWVYQKGRTALRIWHL